MIIAMMICTAIAIVSTHGFPSPLLRRGAGRVAYRVTLAGSVEGVDLVIRYDCTALVKFTISVYLYCGNDWI